MNAPLPEDGTIEILKQNPSANPQLDQLDMIAALMDNAFQIPGTNIRFGADSVIGLIPVIGDTLTVAISAFLISKAKDMGVPGYKRWQMRFNIFMDWLIGCIPLIGDLFDVGWKANSRNVAIMRKYAEQNSEILDGETL